VKKTDDFKLIKKLLIKNSLLSEDLSTIAIYDVYKKFKNIFSKNKILAIYGERGVGKTYLIKYTLKRSKISDYLYQSICDLNTFLNKNLKHKIYFYRFIFDDFKLFVFDDMSKIFNYPNLRVDFTIFLNNFKKHKNSKILFVYDTAEIEHVEKIFESFDIKEFKLFKINPPSLEEKVSYINQLIETTNLSLDLNKVIYLAQTLKNFDQIKKELLNKKLQKRFILKDPVEKTISQISSFFGVRPEDVLSSKRTKEISLARQVVIYVLKNVHNFSILNLSRLFKKKHPAVIYSLKKVERLKFLDKKINKLLTSFEHSK